MENLITQFLVYFWALFFVIDAIGVVPMFLALTAEGTDAYRKKMANMASVTAFFIMSFFTIAGAAILKAFGISLAAFKIGGGILLLILSIEMVFGKSQHHNNTEVEQNGCGEDISVFPLSIPLLSGPGAITLLIMYMQQAGKDPLKIGGVFLALFVNVLIVWVLLRFSSKICGILGKTGIGVVTKIFGILLTAMACQFFINGIIEAFSLK